MIRQNEGDTRTEQEPHETQLRKEEVTKTRRERTRHLKKNLKVRTSEQP